MKVKEYTYAVFLRCPKTGETQHGTVTISTKREGDFLSFWDLNDAIFQQLKKVGVFQADYTMIAMQIVSVEDVEVDEDDDG